MRDEIAQVINRDQVMELVYGNNSRPKDILGRHPVSNGQVISAYHPDAVEMYVVNEAGVRYPMDPVERHHIFAAFFPTRTPFDYKIDMVFPDGNHFLSEDPYSFDSVITVGEEKQFTQGVWENCYKKMGAHPMTVHGVEGVSFAVWAPNARRVSVTGDFNYWNGMIHPMQRLDRSGIFELFIPGIKTGTLYRFEVKTWNSGIVQKVDPFGCINLDGNGDVSIILDINEFRWDDQQWMKDRRRKDWNHSPLSVCDRKLGDRYLEEYLSAGCFTHVLLESPPFCHGMGRKIREKINSFHKRGIGVLLGISPGWFPDEENGLKYYDGSALFGHTDPALRYEEGGRRIRFRHDSPQILNYLTSQLLFWIKEYHIDGFLVEGVTEMVYPLLPDGEEYSREYAFYQQESEAFLRHMVKTVKKEDFSVLMIAEEKQESCSPLSELQFEAAGFDLLVDYSISDNLRQYVASSRSRSDGDYYRLSQPLMKNGIRYSMLNLSAPREILDELLSSGEEMVSEYDRLSVRKLLIGYMLGVPGKKRWTLQKDEQVGIQQYLKDLLILYRKYGRIMYRPGQASFQWINGMDASSRVLSFVRWCPSGNANLLFICNFDREKKVGFRVGVPKYSSYRLAINSDWEEYEGARRKSPVTLEALPQEWDLQPYSLRLTISGHSVLIYEF